MTTTSNCLNIFIACVDRGKATIYEDGNFLFEQILLHTNLKSSGFYPCISIKAIIRGTCFSRHYGGPVKGPMKAVELQGSISN